MEEPPDLSLGPRRVASGLPSARRRRAGPVRPPTIFKLMDTREWTAEVFGNKVRCPIDHNG